METAECSVSLNYVSKADGGGRFGGAVVRRGGPSYHPPLGRPVPGLRGAASMIHEQPGVNIGRRNASLRPNASERRAVT
jgi:hypothetical protein